MSVPSLIAAFLLLSAAPTAAPPPSAAPQAATPAAAPTADIVASRLTVPDGDRPALEVGVWAPARGSGPRPLIVISHGNGGEFRSHQDTAEALARAGFVVATLTHTGDNWRDQSRATDVLDRSRQLSVLIDYMLADWDGRAGVDPDRIGAFGFSSGGFTVLTAAGGVPDMGRLVEHCREHPDFFDCGLLRTHGVAPGAAPSGRHAHADPRIRAVVSAAPALGFTFTRDGLAGVTVPLQLWQAGQDHVLPAPWYAEPVRDALPRPPEYHRVEGADHFDFLSPCTPQLAAMAPIICAPTPGFDRAAFHEIFNREIVRFFEANL